MLRCTFYTHHLSSCPLWLMGETTEISMEPQLPTCSFKTCDLALQLWNFGLNTQPFRVSLLLYQAFCAFLERNRYFLFPNIISWSRTPKRKHVPPMAAKQHFCVCLLDSAPRDQIAVINWQFASKRRALSLLQEPWHKCDIQQTHSLRPQRGYKTSSDWCAIGAGKDNKEATKTLKSSQIKT